MKSYQQPPSAVTKKTGMKREGSPFGIPYKRKARGKETRRGSCQNPVGSKTARERRCACTCTYAEAGEAADEIIDNCFRGATGCRGYFALLCRHHDRNRIVDRAYAYAAYERQGEVRNGLAAFLAWLDKTYPRQEAK